MAEEDETVLPPAPGVFDEDDFEVFHGDDLADELNLTWRTLGPPICAFYDGSYLIAAYSTTSLHERDDSEEELIACVRTCGLIEAWHDGMKLYGAARMPYGVARQAFAPDGGSRWLRVMQHWPLDSGERVH